MMSAACSSNSSRNSWRAWDGVPAIGVRLDAVAHLASQEAVHRLVQRLADDVPAGHLDRADRRHGDFTSAGIVIAKHARDQVFHLERIAAENMVGHRFG